MNEDHGKLVKIVLLTGVLYGSIGLVASQFVLGQPWGFVLGLVMGVFIMLVNLRLLIFAGEDLCLTGYAIGILAVVPGIVCFALADQRSQGKNA